MKEVMVEWIRVRKLIFFFVSFRLHCESIDFKNIWEAYH